MWELEILQELTEKNGNYLFNSHRFIRRRHSTSSLDKKPNTSFNDIDEKLVILCSKELQVTTKKRKNRRKFVFQPVNEIPENYAEFLKLILDSYNSLCECTAELEKHCQKILSKFQEEPKLEGYSIHKSLFLQIILQDKAINVWNMK